MLQNATEHPQEPREIPSDWLTSAASAELDRLDSQLLQARERLAILGEPVATEGERVASSREAAEFDIRLAEKEHKLFQKERGSAGEYKWEKIGRELRGMLAEQVVAEKDGKAELVPNERLAVAEKEGRLELAPNAEGRRFLAVNMGELDRFNKEGGSHTAGDLALRATVAAVEQSVLGVLAQRGSGDERSKRFLIGRFSGNEFFVSLDDVDEGEMRQITEAVAAARPTIPGVKDGAPLSAASFSLQDALDAFNPVLSEQLPGMTEDERARDVITALKMRASQQLEVEKFRVRTERVLGKVREAGSDPDKKAEAEKFYATYLSKMFGGTPLSSIAAFEELLTLPEEDRAHKVNQMAFEAAGRAVFVENERQKQISNSVSRQVAEAYRVSSQESAAQGAEALPAGLVGEFHGGKDEKPAQIPQTTRGLEARKLAAAALQEAEASGDQRRIAEARMDLNIFDAEHDAGTGLKRRSEYYEALEKSLSAEGEPQPSTVVFVDMAFLKYFNKGGNEVGDAAIFHSAHLLEEALAASGVKGDVYRYGGDEFAVRMEGEAKDAAVRFRQALSAEMERRGTLIPVGKKGMESGYVPGELRFNYGTADTGMLQKMFQDLAERRGVAVEEVRSGFSPNQQAELMTLLADKMVETEKAVSRCRYLLEKAQQASNESDPERRALLAARSEQLESFSMKSIFGDAGGKEMLASWKKKVEAGEDIDGLLPDIEGWVAEKLRDAQGKEQQGDSEMRSFIELQVRIAYYQQEITSLRQQKGEDHQHVQQLKRLYEDANKRLEGITAAKKILGN